MTDLTQPGWRPEYRGDNSLGDIGSGHRLGAHLYYLYRAGRNDLPRIAQLYSDLTSQIHQITGTMQNQFNVPGQGPNAAHQRLLELRDEVHDVLRQTSLRMSETGAALVTIADMYAATDEAAAAEFGRLMDLDAQDYQHPAPVVPDPPAVGDPPPPPPQQHGHLAY